MGRSLRRFAQGSLWMANIATFEVEVFSLGMGGTLLHEFSIGVPWVAVNQVTEVGFMKATFKGAKGRTIIYLWEMRILMIEASDVL